VQRSVARLTAAAPHRRAPEHSALTQVDAGRLHVQLSGRLAYLLWRSVYATKQVSARNRLLILFDWLKTRLFGRDISQF